MQAVSVVVEDMSGSARALRGQQFVDRLFIDASIGIQLRTCSMSASDAGRIAAADSA
jgi:hypothetical protein